jgi:hypothetical protein
LKLRGSGAYLDVSLSFSKVFVSPLSVWDGNIKFLCCLLPLIESEVVLRKVEANTMSTPPETEKVAVENPENEKVALENQGRSSAAPSFSDESLTNPTGINEKALVRKLDFKLLPPLTLLYLLSFLDRSNSMSPLPS